MKPEKEISQLKEQVKWLRKFVWEDSINLKYDLEKTIPPFRIGKKQKRAILDSKGHEVGIFVAGEEKIAQVFCDFLNANYNPPVQEQTSNDTSKVTRFEVIDEKGRVYTNYNCNIELSFQDENRTLKVFIKSLK